MRVPDTTLKSIGFVIEVYDNRLASLEVEPIGTCFFVGVASESAPGTWYCYAVTSKHIVKDSKFPIGLVVNKTGGGTELVNSGRGSWIFHPDNTVDLAVIEIRHKPEYDTVLCNIDDLYQEGAYDIGPGDQVFFPGLFTGVPGQDRVIPLVRSGNIAMLPGQSIQTEYGYAEMYLIEARSIGGLSGSPVFVRATLHVQFNSADGKHTGILAPGLFKLLGINQGHWDVKESEINDPQVRHDAKRGVNYGIAKVVPAKKLLEILQSPELVARRRKNDDWAREHSVMKSKQDGNQQSGSK